ncbi:MAG: putative DNA binding domain-containing protein [Candidatus Cloacimonetes bacterium]|nr:putative DNA binding domain-containing protein [Candidatus Cloacimonadota bacterium]
MKELLYKQESKTLEFKRELNDFNKEKVLQTIIAFANGSGGNFVFGVDDNKKIVGIAQPFDLEEQLSNIVFDSINPTIRIDAVFITEQNKTIVVIKTPLGIETPYYLKNKGMEQGTYIRVGSTTRLASKEIIKSLQLRGENISYDSQIDYRFSKDDIDFLKMKKFFKEKKDIEIKEDHLFMFNLLARSDRKIYPTVAGMLLFPKKEYIEYDYAKIKCAHFKGNTPDIFIDKAEFRGSLINQIEATIKFIKSNIKLSATIGDVYREEKYEYPLPALREAIVNAVTHRNYLLKGQDIKVAIFDNSIEISSPGELPAGYSVEDIGKIDFSKLRNIVIGRVFSELKIIEQWGRGFSNIIESCKQYENIVPEFKEELLKFKIIFWNKKIDKKVGEKVGRKVGGKVGEKVGRKGGQKRWSEKVVRKGGQKRWSELTERQEEILNLIEQNNKISRKQLSDILNINPSAIQKHINKIKQKGLLKRIGPDKGGYWEIVE